MVTRVDKYLGGLGIDATGKLEVTDNASVVVGNGSTTGNVYAGTINSSGVELRANDYATLLSAYSNDGATLLTARSNDYSTLLTAYSNDGSTLATARSNDFNTYSVVLGGLTGANTAITNLQTGLSGSNTRLSGSESNVISLQGGISGSNTRLTGSESNVIALQGGISGTNTNLSGNVAIFSGAFTGSNTRLAGAESNVIALQGGLSGANTINTTQTTNITNLTSGLTGANTNISAITNSPVTFQSNVTILGNLTLAGNTTIVTSNTISFGDTLLSLGANNTSSDNLDIGLYGHYWNGTANSHSGIFRSAVSKDWMLFSNYTIDLEGNSTVTISNSSFQLGTLRLANANAGFNVSAANAVLGAAVYSNGIELRSNDYATYLMAKGGVDAANTAISAKAPTANPTFTGTVTTPLLTLSAGGGIEGGQLDFANAVTSTTITTGIAIDIYGDKIRFFEKGGTTRGAFLDLSLCGTGVGSNLLSTTSSNVYALEGGLAGANAAIALKAPSASPTFTGSATFDTNTFYVDATNDRVGVLTTAPGYSLDVRGTANVGALTATSISIIPSGAIIMFGANTAPSGWLVCDGTAVSRTTYSSLFTTIATNYGVGDNTTTFNLPDFRGRSPYGVDALQSITIGGTTAGKINSSYQNSTGTGTTGSGTTGSGTTGTSATAITATTSNATTTTASSTSTGTTATGTGTIPALTYSTGTGSTGTGTTGGSTTGGGTGTIPGATYSTGVGTTGGGTTGGGTTGSTADTNTITTSTTNSTTDKDVTNSITVVTSVTPIAHTHAIPGLSVPGLSVPALSIPAMSVSVPGLTVPGLSVPGLSVPALSIPAMNVSVPGLSIPALTIPSLTVTSHTHNVPALTIPGLSIPGLSIPGLSVPALTVTYPATIVQFIIKT